MKFVQIYKHLLLLQSHQLAGSKSTLPTDTHSARPSISNLGLIAGTDACMLWQEVLVGILYSNRAAIPGPAIVIHLGLLSNLRGSIFHQNPCFLIAIFDEKNLDGPAIVAHEICHLVDVIVEVVWHIFDENDALFGDFRSVRHGQIDHVAALMVFSKVRPQIRKMLHFEGDEGITTHPMQVTDAFEPRLVGLGARGLLACDFLVCRIESMVCEGMSGRRLKPRPESL